MLTQLMLRDCISCRSMLTRSASRGAAACTASRLHGLCAHADRWPHRELLSLQPHAFPVRSCCESLQVQAEHPHLQPLGHGLCGLRHRHRPGHGDPCCEYPIILILLPPLPLPQCHGKCNTQHQDRPLSALHNLLEPTCMDALHAMHPRGSPGVLYSGAGQPSMRLLKQHPVSCDPVFRLVEHGRVHITG